nr:MAG TPA: E10-like protein [Crassvirales sp.]
MLQRYFSCLLPCKVCALRFIGKISTSVDTEVVFYHETLHVGT